MNTVAIVIARTGSSRLPGKVLKYVGHSAVLSWVTRALEAVPSIDKIVVATTTEPADSAIAEWAAVREIPCYRGSETDVLERVYLAAKEHQADVVIRTTGDCPFLDPSVIEQVIQLRARTGADYASNIDPPTWPDGLDVEAFTFQALEAAHNEATRPTDRECVTRYIARNRHRWKAETLICPIPDLHKERWVLDTADDMEFCSRVAAHLPPRRPSSYTDILRTLDRHPELRTINEHHPRNERFYAAVAAESPDGAYNTSAELLDRARKVIPFGAQTFSKSHIQYPVGDGPLFVTHGDGAYLFSVDGGDYVDLVSGLMPVILGYRHPAVDGAIRRQLSSGITFSTSTELEAELAELLCRHIPCAEMVKFGKNGSDVTAAAVRLARAFTGRNYILLSGYHGWHDWSISTTERNLGTINMQYTQAFTYGDRAELEQIGWKNMIAGIIVEPNEDKEYLQWLREFCSRNGIVLIFDEVITGFRYSLGGAQQYFGVTPDLACFGKAMGNGMPISAIAGRKDIMQLMEPAERRGNIFYSGTMFGETLSIAAAIACIRFLEEHSVPDVLSKRGNELNVRLQELAERHDINNIVVSGHPSRLMLKTNDHPNATGDEIKTLFIKEMIRNGVLIINSNNLTFAHDEAALGRIYRAYDNTLATISQALKDGKVREALGNTPVIGPVTVRSYERPKVAHR